MPKKPSAGDKVRIHYKDEKIKGVLMPEEEEYFYVKMDSGYNIGLKKKDVKKVDVLKKKKDLKQKKSKVKKDDSLPTISILHTGGTIASKVDYETGAVIAKFTESEIISMFPELSEMANINSRLVRNMQSEMIRFPHYNLLAKEIKKEAEKGVDGIIVTQGTDTLHYTSAALSFVLENIGIPVMVVGSQRSSDRGSTDSAYNLIAAVKFMAEKDFSGVAICMHAGTGDDICNILPACKTRKMHTSRRDAFRPINSKPIATINLEKEDVEILSEYDKKDKDKKIKLRLFDEKIKVGLLKPHPHMFASEIEQYKDFDGLVIELFGIGHLPTMKVDEFTEENAKIYQSVKKLANNIPVVGTSQTIYGRVDMNVYSPGRQLIEAGIMGNYTDMTPETAFIKLAWLLSNHKKDVENLIAKNLRGEISKRSEKKNYLI